MTIKENVKYLTNVNLAIDKIAELEKENAELKAQIEKMKCCENCKYGVFSDGICIDCSYDERFQPLGRCKNRSNWELAE